MYWAGVDFRLRGSIVVFVGLFFDGRLEVMIHDRGLRSVFGRL